jgi:hypothetical protein
MKTLKLCLIFAFCAGIIPALSGADSSYNPQWGIGVIMPKVSNMGDLTPGVQIPPQGFTIYEMPSGKKFARLTVSDNGAQIDDNGQTRVVDELDLVQLNAETYCLKIYETTANYIKILSASRKGGYWIASADLKKTPYLVTDWMKVLLTVKSGLLVQAEEGLNLRDAPSTNGNKIVTMKGETFIITLTGKTKDSWAEMEVIEYDGAPCEGDMQELNHYKGWAKIIDDKKFPNLWYLVIGC